MKKLLLATTAVLGLAVLPGVAHATLVWDIVTGVNATGANAGALQANAAGFAAATSAAAGGVQHAATSTNENLISTTIPLLGLIPLVPSVLSWRLHLHHGPDPGVSVRCADE